MHELHVSHHFETMLETIRFVATDFATIQLAQRLFLRAAIVQPHGPWSTSAGTESWKFVRRLLPGHMDRIQFAAGIGGVSTDDLILIRLYPSTNQTAYTAAATRSRNKQKCMKDSRGMWLRARRHWELRAPANPQLPSQKGTFLWIGRV